MQISVLAVGKLKESYWQDAQAEYRKRLSRYCRLKVAEAKDDAGLIKLTDGCQIFAFDEKGELPDSNQFASWLDEARVVAQPLALVVGGADGLPLEIKQRAVRTISFGRMTIAHRIARVLVLEQLYRGFRILHGEPYHR